MYKLLVDMSSGEQREIVVLDGGGFVGDGAVIWDERTDGAMPPITIGKMVKVGDALVEHADYLPAYGTWMADQQAITSEKQRVETIRQSALTDVLANQMRGMTEAEIDTWCDANITSIADLKMLMKKIIRILVAMNEGK